MIFFIQDCPFNKIDSILRQADEIGLISDYHNYLITNMVKARLFSFLCILLVLKFPS